MHELSIAMSIVDVVNDNVSEEEDSTVKLLELEIGTQAGVVDDALSFAMEEAFKGTVLENAEIVITRVQAEAKCDACQHVFEVEELFTPCPKCNQIRNEIVKGKELKVKKLIVE